MAPRRINNNAFLLLEAVLAVAVLSLGLVFIIQAMNKGMKIASASSNYTRAVNLAYEKLFELELASQDEGLELGYSEREFNNWGFAQRYNIEKLENSNLGSLILEISWKGETRAEKFTVETYARTRE